MELSAGPPSSGQERVEPALCFRGTVTLPPGNVARGMLGSGVEVRAGYRVD